VQAGIGQIYSQMHRLIGVKGSDNASRHAGLANIEQDASVAGIHLDVRQIAQLLPMMTAALRRNGFEGSSRGRASSMRARPHA